MIDQGSIYVSKYLKLELGVDCIQLFKSPKETPGATGTVERYHFPSIASLEKSQGKRLKITTDQ